MLLNINNASNKQC